MVDGGGGGSDLDLPTTLFLHNSPQTFAGTLIHSECFVLQSICYIYYVKISGSETLSLKLRD